MIQRTERNYGIDLLRLVLMFLVVLLHVLGHGGVLYANTPSSANYYLCWTIECLAYCAVNCYALITGYVYINAEHKYSALFTIWLQVLLYSAGGSVCVWLLRPDLFSFRGLLNAFFPIVRGTYWYVSAYACLFILIPLLNAAIENLSERLTKATLLLLGTLLCVLPTFLRGDPGITNNGYSTFWLIYLYLIGACIRKWNWADQLSARKCAILYILCATATSLNKFLLEILTSHFFGTPGYGDILISYTSPTIVAAAIFLFLAFKKLSFGKQSAKWIAVFSPAAFGVYLIHEQPHVKGHFIQDTFSAFAAKSPLGMLVSILAAAIAIFTICLLIDLVRNKLFRLLRIRQRLEQAEEKIRTSIAVR